MMVDSAIPAPAPARQQLYAEDKFTEILAPWQRPAQRRGWQFHRRAGTVRCGARPAGLPGGKNAGDEQAKASLEIKGFLGWLESYLGAKVEDLTPKTKLQSYYEQDYEGFLAVLKKNSKKLQVDPGQTGARAGAAGRVRGVDGQTRALAREDQEDGRTDRCDGVQAVRAHGRGDRDCGGGVVPAIVIS